MTTSTVATIGDRPAVHAVLLALGFAGDAVTVGRTTDYRHPSGIQATYVNLAWGVEVTVRVPAMPSRAAWQAEVRGAAPVGTLVALVEAALSTQARMVSGVENG